MSSDTDEAASDNEPGWPPPRQLDQETSTETPKMKSAHISHKNPITPGDRSLAGKKRVYEKGRKNRTRS